jgi:hypothetical protein
MAYSDSNRYVSEIRRGNGEEKGIPVQDREKDSTSRQSIGTSDVWETNKEYVPNTNTGFSIRENKEIQSRGNAITNGSEDVSNSNGERSQGYKLQHDLETRKQISEHNGKTSSKRQQTWWEIESELCGVPNGVSYELDKDRSNRIKALGNSIVPQIARQIGLAIMEAELNGKI